MLQVRTETKQQQKAKIQKKEENNVIQKPDLVENCNSISDLVDSSEVLFIHFQSFQEMQFIHFCRQKFFLIFEVYIYIYIRIHMYASILHLVYILQLIHSYIILWAKVPIMYLYAEKKMHKHCVGYNDAKKERAIQHYTSNIQIIYVCVLFTFFKMGKTFFAWNLFLAQYIFSIKQCVSGVFRFLLHIGAGRKFKTAVKYFRLYIQ